MSRVMCPACGEKERVTVNHMVHDGRRMVTITCTQIIHAEPLISLVDDSDPLSNGPSSDIDTAILLTWRDPEVPSIDDDTLDSHGRDGLDEAGSGVVQRWSAGRRKHGVKVGSRVFLLKQFGTEGILARGIAQGTPYQDLGTGDDTHWLDVRWDVWLPVDSPLPLAQLVQDIPDGNWSHRFQSGTGLDEQASLDVETAFEHHLAAVRAEA